ncbi:hypothetical protein J6590_030430, partial [Homalodisca vitripennis]
TGRDLGLFTQADVNVGGRWRITVSAVTPQAYSARRAHHNGLVLGTRACHNTAVSVAIRSALICSSLSRPGVTTVPHLVMEVRVVHATGML